MRSVTPVQLAPPAQPASASAACAHRPPQTPSAARLKAARLAGPAFSWSYSRQQLFERCERLYYEHYYGSHRGWSADAPARARLAYRLRHLTSPAAALGHAVHRRAAEIARAIRDGTTMPTAEMLLRTTRAELGAVVMRHVGDPAWRRDPRGAPVLHEVFYSGMGPARRRQLLDDLTGRAIALQSTLLDSLVWRAANAPGGRIVLIDEPILLSVDGVPLTATPDLVLQLADDHYVVVDWKTGSIGSMSQPVLYTHAARQALGSRATAARFDAWLVHLDRAVLEARLVTSAEVARALAEQRASMSRMRAMTTDPLVNSPGAREGFAMAADPNRVCRRCRMLELCSPELRETPTAAQAAA